MKMKLFFRISVLALCILMSLSSFADDKKDRSSVEEIEWSANNQSLTSIVSTPDNPTKTYLYATGPKKFVTVGGRYGAQPILAEVGMNFYVEKIADDDRYYIHSWVHNPTTSQGTGNADYLGVEPLMDTDQRIEFTDSKGAPQKSIYLYVDRGINNTHDDGTNPSPDRIKWHITPVGTDNGYKIYSTWTDNLGGHSDNEVRKYYLSYYEGPTEEKPQKKFLVVTTDESLAETFYFINIDDYREVINNQNKKYINVSGLVQDARFERNNKGIDGTDDLEGDYGTTSKDNVWQFRYDRNDDAYFFPHWQKDVEELAYMTAWVGSEGSKEGNGNYLIQKITGLKPGLYRVNCQGFYFNPDNIDDKDNTSFVFASQDYKDISNQTALKTIELNDWYMMRDGTYNGSAIDGGKNGFTEYSIKHCVNAGKIFAESNPYEDKDVDSRKYDSSVAVLVKADEGSTTGTGTLYIGAGKRANGEGYAFFDNFQLFYMGNKEWYLDATNTSTEEFNITQNNDGSYTPSGINHNNGTDPYNYPVTYNIRRYFHKDQWESLILPCSLTGDQVKQTFGGEKEVKLSVFEEVKGTCVKFRTVDLDNEGIVAGQPYIIKVGKDADIKTKDIEYTFPWGNDAKVKVKGPIYQVKGVVPPTFTGNGVTTEDKTSTGGYKVQFQGFYYKPEYAPAGAYVVNNGNMYHLTSAWNSFVGTSWYVTITDEHGKPKALSFSFDGDSSTTAIENVTRQEDAAVQTDGFVYNLSGQRVGTRNNMSNLSSGIYVVAGKKFVVK